MSRMVQARVTDSQYAYLEELAYESFAGDLSGSLRWCIEMAEHFQNALNSGNPGDYVRDLLKKWQDDYDAERTTFRMDQPGDEHDEG